VIAAARIGLVLALGLAGCTSSGFNRPVELERTSEVLTDCGVRYVDIQVGDGIQVLVGTTVEAHYVGYLDDGTAFDSSHDRGVPLSFVIGAGEVISGWEEGMIGMRAGGVRRIVIPPDCAYGAKGHRQIPPDATVVLEVELLDVRVPGS
jgi:FKBP-type peptidyl-prolyl cis-trans isomerase